MPGPNDPRPARKLPDLGKQRRVPVEPQQPEEPQAEAPKKRRANLGEEVRVAAKRKRPIDIPVERPIDGPVRRPVDHPVDVHPQRPDRPVEVPVQRFDAGQIAQLQIDRRVPTVVIDPGLVIPPIKIPRVPEGSSQAAPAPEVTLDHHVEVIRSADLVSMVVSTSGFDLADGVFTTAADGPGGLLVFTLPFQHLGEQAFYEGIPAPQPNPADPDGPPVQSSGGPEQPTNPVGGIPARATRVVLQVPAGESVEVTSSALLAALEKYPMAVHPLATPGAPYRRNPFNPRLVQVLANAGLIQHVLAADEQPAFTDLHAADTTAGIAQRARALAQVRATLNAPAAHAAVTELVDDWRIPVTKLPPIFRNPEKLSRPPGTGETAIEAPYRLVVSPSTQSGWTHADDPVPDTSGTAVELWHTRLGHREADGTVTEAEQTIRAVWARDRERFDNWPGTDFPPETPEVPMRMSLNSSDRHMLVRQSSEVWAKNRTKIADPTPVEADRLYLSSLGAWLDLHGEWDTLPWSTATLSSIMSWDHEAPMGRDQYVRVVYPGYLFPFGHKATLVKVTERKIKSKTDPKATLFQRKFIVVGEPVKTYTDIGNPFKRVEIAPTITPILSPEPTAAQEQSFFVVQCGGGPFQFVLHCIDADDREVKLPTPLVWVAEKYALPNPAGNAATPIKAFADLGPINGLGQNVSFAPSEPGGVDLAVPTVALTFSGTIPSVGKAVPQFVSAKATIPAVERMKPTGPQEFTYADAWLQHGFGAGNEGQVWAELTSPTTLGFGSGGASSGGAGGFIAPSLPIAALSRSQGPVGDAATVAAGDFDPAKFLGAALPKLFGFVSLVDILSLVGIDLNDAPALVTESLATVEALMSDLKKLKKAVEDAAAEAQSALTRAQQTANDLTAQGRAALDGEVLAKAQEAATTATNLVGGVVNAADGVLQAIIDAPGDLAGAPGKLAAALNTLAGALNDVEAATEKLTPLAKNQLLGLVKLLREAATDASTVQSVIDFVQGIATAVADARFSFKWQPKLQSWPNEAKPVLQLPERGLTLAVEGQAGKNPKAEVLAELRGFALILPPGEPMMKLPFDHLMFKAGSSGKAEVDASVGNIEFVGILSFVERIKQLIPLDGFSDPPYVDVKPDGVTAGFSLDLPNLAIGVFSLSNMSLAADVRVPFLGDVVSVGFGFCTRERPFNLAVLCLGGGGWFGIRLSPRGLEVLELGLEAGAYLSINLGVASGSVSMAIGIYLRMEADKGSLTAYFRLRGEVSVLGLISASIELYLSLTYDFPSGKLTGTATITVKVKVLCFSKSVSITCQRSFAGSNGDPTFAEVMGVQPDFTSPLWTDYCLAFAEE